MPLFGAPGERIGYAVYPHPDGAPPLVLIHGFTASRASFEVNLDGLREHFTVIAVELLGHGDSDAPEDPAAYRPERAERRILQLLEHLGFQQALVCGHSLGGALALRLALDAPEWVAGLVVINSSSAAGSPEWRDASQSRMREIAARVRAEGTGFMKSTRLYPAHSRRLDPLSRELLTRDFDRLQPAGLAGTAESLVVDVNAWERHPELAVPMLLVVGAKDADFAPNAPAFLSRFPQEVRSIVLPSAGHAANIEQPREFEDAVVKFAREIGYLAEPSVDSSNRMLTALGGALVFAGLGLLAAAVMFSGGGDDNDNKTLAAEPDATRPAASSTAVANVAGTRTGGPTAAAVPAIVTPAPSPAVAAAAAPTQSPEPAPVPATAVPRAPTATPVPQDTPTPAPTATPLATATPSGPRAAINGPSSGIPGETLVFSDGSSPAPLTRNWALPSGPVNAVAGVSFTPAAPGCYSVSLTAYFADGKVLTTSRAVSVGGVACGTLGISPESGRPLPVARTWPWTESRPTPLATGALLPAERRSVGPPPFRIPAPGPRLSSR